MGAHSLGHETALYETAYGAYQFAYPVTYTVDMCPHAVDLIPRTVYLPVSPLLTEGDMHEIVLGICKVHQKIVLQKNRFTTIYYDQPYVVGNTRKQVTMMASERVCQPIRDGWTALVDWQFNFLQMGTLLLLPGESYRLHTYEREYACVLVYGECEATVDNDLRGRLGPRANPFDDPPFALFVTREQSVSFKASKPTLIGVGSAPAEKHKGNWLITPDQIGGGQRGSGNWQREVRFVCWSDNTEGNMLLAGETCTPSGNWSTMPPHRHQFDIPGEEVPYEELYFFQFSRPEGFGLLWQFDDNGLDRTYSIKHNDIICIDGGYHPLVCGPGSMLYHLTLMAGPYRVSRASVHPKLSYLLEDEGMENPYKQQFVRKGGRRS